MDTLCPARRCKAAIARETYEQAMENIKDAIHLHIQDRLGTSEEIPEPVSVSLSTVKIAI